MEQVPTSERAWQAKVVEAAKWLGWAVYHTHDSRRSEAGFPDLVLVRDTRLVFAELKSASGRTTPAQEAWLLRLHDTGAEVHVWRPEHWPQVQETLAR
jgi:hypothetical protein